MLRWPTMKASIMSAVGMGALGLGGSGGDCCLAFQVSARRAAHSCAIWASNSASNPGLGEAASAEYLMSRYGLGAAFAGNFCIGFDGTTTGSLELPG